MSRRWILVRLLRSGLLAPRSLLAFARAVWRSGPNLVALARFGGASGKAMLADEARRIGFAALADEAERLAALLRDAHGAGRGKPIAVIGANSVALVLCLLAASRLGARTILLNPHLPPEQIGLLLDRHAVSLVLAPDGADIVPDGAGRIVCDPARLPPAKLTRRLPRSGGGDIVVLTGGTTGLPKPAGRAARPGSVLRLFLHLLAALRLERRRAILVAVPLFHGFGLAALVMALALGRTVHLRRRFDAGEAAALIDDQAIDTLAVVPTMLQRLLSATAGRLPLRCIVSGGAPLPPQVAGEARARFGDVLFNLYGTSEAGLCALATPADLGALPGTIGRAVWGAEIALRDAGGEEVAPGVAGEVFVRNRAAVTPGAWLRTGDLAVRDAHGRLMPCGRADDMIISGGENVSPWELETVLLAHPDVAEAAAVGVPDVDFGQRLIAFAVPRAGCTPDGDELRRWLAARVARHQQPRLIVLRASLPLTAIGKVDRRALAEA